LNSTTVSHKTTPVTSSISTNLTNTTLIKENEVNPSNKTYIIILCTVIPVVLVVAIGIIIKIKQSSLIRSSSKKRRLLTKKKNIESSTNDFELKPSDDNDSCWY
jgi:hypothetical protein